MPEYYEKNERVDKKIYKKIAGVILITIGLGIFLYFLFPVIAYQVFLGDYIQTNLEVPIPKYMVLNGGMDFGGLISQGISSLTSDYNDARNWYPSLPSNTVKHSKVDSYLLSIPKLGIDNATVSTRDYDLDHHLVQYLGTAIPGQNGTAVIFGHSTIPAWFDQKNYKTIFATLHTIKVGDEINITVQGTQFKYKIFSIVITSPDDTNILSQSFDHSYITLVTCTPPGTIWKRLIIHASLETLNAST
ncbi:MAG TPA: sortase [Patescibacteria group bacterium]|nr:sortase [Patescibacteria group bacterium]